MSGSSTAETKSKTDTTPWAPQASALTSAFNNANSAYGKSSSAVAPTDFTAQMTPEQLATFRTMVAQGGSTSIPNQDAATGAALSTAGVGGVTGALSGLGSYNPASTNNADANIANANKYVAGQDIPGAVRAAMQGATETARDVTMPGIEQHAAATGNINSSRTGVADGIVQRGLAEQAGNLSTTLTNKAYTDGLALSSKTATDNNSAALSALMSRGSIGNTSAASGVDANSKSLADQGTLNNTALAGGTGLQTSQQTALDNLLKQYQSKTSSPYDSLNGLMSIIGSQNWGASSTGDSTTTSTPSAWQIIGGLMSSAGSLAGGLSGKK